MGVIEGNLAQEIACEITSWFWEGLAIIFTFFVTFIDLSCQEISTFIITIAFCFILHSVLFLLFSHLKIRISKCLMLQII